jgi:hypothetical protein
MRFTCSFISCRNFDDTISINIKNFNSLGAGKPSKWKRPIVLLSAAISSSLQREFQLLVENLQQ